MEEIIAVLVERFTVDEKGKTKLWVRVFPWLAMACMTIVCLAYAYGLVRS